MFPFKMAVVGTLLAQYFGRGPGPLYIGLATTVGGHLGSNPSQAEPHIHKNTPREDVLPLYYSSLAPEAIHTPHN